MNKLIDEVIDCALRYEEAWTRYANPARYPTRPSDEELILTKGKAHQTLLEAIRKLQEVEADVKRFAIGRFSLYLEPRDIWIGIYVAPKAIYVCPLPLIVFRWSR